MELKQKYKNANTMGEVTHTDKGNGVQMSFYTSLYHTSNDLHNQTWPCYSEYVPADQKNIFPPHSRTGMAKI